MVVPVAVLLCLEVAVVFKVRVAFEKKEFSKYISHLDLMKLFQRVFKIAEIDITYSSGFNPHPKMSIGNPLPLGVTGDCEFMDIVVNSEPDFDKIASSMNKVLPEGIRVIRCYTPELPMNVIKKSEYTIELHLKEKINNFEDYVEALKKKDDIVISKKTKSGISNVDIKPFIYKFDVLRSEDKFIVINTILATGEPMNLKASSLIDACIKYIPGFEMEYCNINRNAMYDKDNNKFTQ